MQRVKNGSNMNIINIQDNEILIQAKRSYYENIFTFLLIDYPSCLLYDIIIDTRCLFAFIKRIKINVMLCKYYRLKFVVNNDLVRLIIQRKNECF